MKVMGKSTGGGVDFCLWNNVASHNNIFGQVGGRHVINGTPVLKVYHRMHKRLGNITSWDDPQYLGTLKADPDWLQNEDYAINCAYVR